MTRQQILELPKTPSQLRTPHFVTSTPIAESRQLYPLLTETLLRLCQKVPVVRTRKSFNTYFSFTRIWKSLKFVESLPN